MEGAFVLSPNRMGQFTLKNQAQYPFKELFLFPEF